MPDPRTSSSLDVARHRLRERFADDGVVRVEYVVGFVAPRQVSVWLGTETDGEREALRARPGLRETVGRIFDGVGPDPVGHVFSGVVVQSEETVRRDYEGSWFYALR